MGSKNLTYYQFKKIANSLGDNVNDPDKVKQASGITDLDYDLLHEYLTKWNQEHKELQSNIKKSNTLTTKTKNKPQLINNTDNTDNLDSTAVMALFRSTLESSNDGLIIIDNNGKLIDWNDKFFEIAKIPKDALEEGSEEVGLGYIFEQVKDPEKLIFELAEIEQENSFKGDFGEVEFKDGRTIERYTQPLIVNNKPVGRVWTFKDITEEKAARERINILTSAIQSATQGIIILQKNNLVYINDYLQKILDIKNFDPSSKENNINKFKNTKLDFLHDKMLICKEAKKGTVNNQFSIKDDVNNTERWFDLDIFESEYNNVVYNLGIVSEITESKELQDQLTYNAYHDLLTGLENRTSLIKAMRTMISQKQHFVIGYFDIDNFKLINDSLGHHIGDKVIQAIGKLINNHIKNHGIIYRLGGDEFVVLLNNVDNLEQANRYFKEILNIFTNPIKVSEYEFNITFTIGISLYPDDAATPTDLLKNADLAMYQKKAKGKNGIGYYDNEIKEKNLRKITISNQIRKAIDHEELSLNYQPILELKTQKIVSVEALLRWNNEALGGFVPPDGFIGVCEEIGYIDTITYWVFENAVNQLKRWHASGYNNLNMTLNLSGALLYNSNITNNLYKIIKSSGILPNKITIELTEGLFININSDIMNILYKFKELGLKIAIDDFGTGYSSYAYLQKLPIDTIKIDKMFTQALVDSTTNLDPKTKKEDNYKGFIQNRAIVLSVIELAKHAGYDIVAEGVETINQMNFLNEHKCKYGQGYYFSRPLKSDDLERLLYENNMK